ncbi:hypothetical protein [Labrys monachus]|uniref:Uncharacterized protein n=1 Tax=Labrys monachus TaxID=217067 RepID=A0ABU0FDN3_9HYPH|nr:hypothetical protein [Labrys monachus]MDQ0392238.1 hypothetical protein [Labrys monachus]
MDNTIVVGMAGSAEQPNAKFSPKVFIAWQVQPADATALPTINEYTQDGGYTLYLACLHFLTALIGDSPAGAVVHIVVPMAPIAEMFSLGRLEDAAKEGFRSKPDTHRDECRVLWELMQSKGIRVTAEVPEPGSEGAALLKRLRSAASRRRRGVREPTLEDLKLRENPWAKVDTDKLRRDAVDKEP